MEDIFGPVVFAYTRKQALEDGFQVDVSETAREAGITFPTFMNRTVWDSYVEVPPGVTGQDVRGRLWDIVWMLRCAIRAGKGGDMIRYSLLVRNDNRRPKLVHLKSQCGPKDIDDASPAITIMLPDED